MDDDVPELTITERTVNGWTVVAVAGEVDMATADQLRHALDAHVSAQRPLILDLARVTFLDSTGLGLLVSLRRRLPAATPLRLSGAIPNVARVFAITGLHQVLPMFDSADASAGDNS